MNFNWLKSILPKGLYGRAALILVAPIVVIQLVVSVVFIQRHFDGVTRQMTTNLARELLYFETQVNAAENLDEASAAIQTLSGPLGVDISRLEISEVKSGNVRTFDDLTGKTVVKTLRNLLPGLKYVDLKTDNRVVLLHILTNNGAYSVSFERSRLSTSNPHQLLVLMVFVSIIMTLISFIFLKNQVRPIRILARAAEAFGKGQHVSFHVAGAREVRQAGQAFLDMRERIERQIEQRTLMLSGVSHDLRTPLTRLKLGLSLTEQNEDISALSRDVDDMQQMLDEFLAFARGDTTERTEPVDPLDLARHVAADAERAQDTVTLLLPEIHDGAIWVPMRPIAMRRALDNLVANALRYGTRCSLRVRLDPGHVLFVVEDDGPGIPADYREIAVRPFERLDIARNQNRGTGVGLGLAIATDIAGSHGGSLDLADSEALGGLKATLRLPR